MNKKNIAFLCAIMCVHLSLGVTNPPEINFGFTPDFIDFSQNDKFLVIENDTRYQVRNLETKTKLIDGTHKFKLSRFFEKGILVFGTKGIGIMDFDGNIIQCVEAKNVKNVMANTNEVWILKNKKFTRINLKEAKITETITFKNRETMVFSPSGKYLLKVNAQGNNIEMRLP